MTTATLTANPGQMSASLPLESPLPPANSGVIPGQPALLPGAAPPLTANGTTADLTSSGALPKPQQVLEGRFLEQLLLNPQSIPAGEQLLLRQRLQQHVTSSQVAEPQAARYQLVSTLLAAADGQPLINPQLLAQLARKQAAAVADHPYRPAIEQPSPGEPLPTGGRADQSARPTGRTPRGGAPIGMQSLAKAIEQALSGDSHSLQQLTQQLVAASRQEALPERHQLLVLATLLLEESDPPLTPMDPRTRRRLGQQLLSALKSGKQAAASATRSAAPRQPSAPRLATARQAIGQGSVGERWSDDEAEGSLPPELLWPGLREAPASVKLTQVEAVLDTLVDKSAPGVVGQGPLHAFIGRASMDQLLMVVTTLMIKVNNISASFVVQSQKINADASGKVMENQLLKQIEEAEKAQQEQENAKKAGIFGAIFNWITAVVATVAAVITMNPLAIAGAVLLIAAAAVETAQLALGSDAPAWLGKLSMGLSIAGGILSAGASLLSSASKALLSAVSSVGKTLMQQGMKAALQQAFKGIFEAVSQALKKLVAWFKALPQAAREGLAGVKNFGKAAGDKIKNPLDSLKQVGQGITNKATQAVDAKVLAKNLPKIAKGLSGSLQAVEGGVSTGYHYKGEMLQAEIKKLANDSWLLDCILEYYQKQRKQLHQGMADLYQQQGEATATASELLQESAGLQNRIAGGLA